MFKAIRYLYPAATHDDFTLQDDNDGRGPRFIYWNQKIGPQPAISDLLTIKPTAEASEAAKVRLSEIRDYAFPAILAYIASKPDAPKEIKDMAVLVAAEKAKIK